MTTSNTTRFFLLSVIVASTPLAACSSSSPADAPSSDGGASTAPDDPPIASRYEAFAAAFDAERQQLGAPGAAVAIIENGEVTFFHGFGTKGPTTTEPVRARTLFRIGSMTKALTATAFMSLAAEGKLDPKAKVKDAIPDVALDPAYLPSLTLEHVLSHQSGLRDLFGIEGPTDDAALSQYLTSSSYGTEDYFMAPPGTFWNYSNPNFFLAGLAVERAGGKPYREVVASRVLTPLGMTRTFFLPSEVVADGDFSNGKSTDPSGQPWDVAPGAYDNAWARPAGYAFSNVLDYARFVKFLNAGEPRALPDAQREDMETLHVSTLVAGSLVGYGYGLFVDKGFRLGNEFYATKLVAHGGDIAGYASDFLLVPSAGFGIVSFANADGAHFQTSIQLALKTFATLPAPTSIPSELDIDLSTFPSFVGTYTESHGVAGTVHVGLNASHLLTISIPQFDAATPPIPYDRTLTAVAPDNFFMHVEGTPLPVTFVRGADGAVTWLRSRFAVLRRGAGDAPVGLSHLAPIDRDALRERLRAHL